MSNLASFSIIFLRFVFHEETVTFQLKSKIIVKLTLLIIYFGLFKQTFIYQ